jgi:hypothetical protein
MTEQTRLDRWLDRAREIAALRTGASDYAAYDRLRREFPRDFPLATPQQAEAVMRELARLFNV